MSGFKLCLIFLLFSYENCGEPKCDDILFGEKGLWECITSYDVNNKKAFEKNAIVYLELKRIDGVLAISTFHGALSPELKTKLSSAVHCYASSNELIDKFEFLFVLSLDNSTAPQKEKYQQMVEQFKSRYNINKQVCELRMGTTAPRH